MEGRIKPFSKQLFLDNDAKGREFLIKYYKKKYNLDLDEYHVPAGQERPHLLQPTSYMADLYCKEKGVFIEVEITNSWKTGSFPKSWGPHTIWERKVKYTTGVKCIFWNLNNDMTQAWWCTSDDLNRDNLKPTGKFDNEYWYVIPAEKVHAVTFDCAEVTVTTI